MAKYVYLLMCVGADPTDEDQDEVYAVATSARVVRATGLAEARMWMDADDPQLGGIRMAPVLIKQNQKIPEIGWFISRRRAIEMGSQEGGVILGVIPDNGKGGRTYSIYRLDPSDPEKNRKLDGYAYDTVEAAQTAAKEYAAATFSGHELAAARSNSRSASRAGC